MDQIKYITEAAKQATEEKLTHLEHAEDHVLNAGSEGYKHAAKTLNAVHDALQGKKSSASITTKYDGSPSIVFGHHPETGKFFVATKSAFNKTPKINYTAKDVDINHGHSPGLAAKLKTVLKHLPKVTPKTGVFQGDVMHSGGKSASNPEGDVVTQGGQAHFTPNTISYSTKDPSETEAARKSKLGVAVHTAYHGSSFDKLKAIYNSGHAGFGDHSDVHLLDVAPSESSIDPKQSKVFQQHMAQADKIHKDLEKTGGYAATQDHGEHIKTYINKTVRTGEQPSVEGYTQHLEDVHQKLADKVKTEKSKDEKITAGMQLVSHVDDNQPHFEKLLQLHHHIQSAKNELVNALSANPNYEHTVDGNEVKPEGFVAVINNRPTKMNDRHEFNRLNFEKNAR